MPPPLRPTLARLLLAAALPALAPARAADLPPAPARPPASGAWAASGAPASGGGFRVAAVPLRPAPRRYDVYGYPLLAGGPDPLAPGGCPAALQPDYDPDGNLAGYAPIPMCR